MVSLATGSVRTVVTSPFRQLPSGTYTGLADWAPDGRSIAFARRTPDGLIREAWEYDLVADTLRRLFDAPGRIAELRYHPAGSWMAYQVMVEDETNVFLRPHAAPGPPVRVSSDGGRWPRWSANGTELIYVDAGDNIVAVPVRLSGSATLGAPRVIVAARVFGTSRPGALDVMPDGKTLIVILNSNVRSLGLVLGWKDQLR